MASEELVKALHNVHDALNQMVETVEIQQQVRERRPGTTTEAHAIVELRELLSDVIATNTALAEAVVAIVEQIAQDPGPEPDQDTSSE